MIIKDRNYWVISKNSNVDYWSQDASPEWTPIGTFKYHPSEGEGRSAEPHYHDADEVWIFGYGHGEAWVDDKIHEVTPGTIVYTPMGSVHRFQMFTEFDNASIVTRLAAETGRSSVGRRGWASRAHGAGLCNPRTRKHGTH